MVKLKSLYSKKYQQYDTHFRSYDTHFRSNRRKSFSGIPLTSACSLDCSSVWQIYFILMVVSKKSGSSWSTKYLKPRFLLEWNVASGNLAAQDFHIETGPSIQKSSHFGQ